MPFGSVNGVERALAASAYLPDRAARNGDLRRYDDAPAGAEQCRGGCSDVGARLFRRAERAMIVTTAS